MLVLNLYSRHAEEPVSAKIKVPPSDQWTEIDVCLVEGRGLCKARIGFEAPRSVEILRSNVKDKYGPNYRGVEADNT